MQLELVGRRRWFSEDEFAKSLALAQLAPGPLAAQVAFCLGYLHSKLRGALAVGLAFILPSFALTLLLGALYLRYGGLPWLAAAFYGVGAVVIGIIVVSAYRLAGAPRKRRLLWGIAAVTAAVTAWRAEELVLLIAAAGVVGRLQGSLRRRATLSVSLLPAPFCTSPRLVSSSSAAGSRSCRFSTRGSSPSIAGSASGNSSMPSPWQC
jgi:chromate transporter